nr:PREDICTED: anoctamin-10-like [Lepisosteus oculatus]
MTGLHLNLLSQIAPLVVLEFPLGTRVQTLEWLLGIICRDRQHGGAELHASVVNGTEKQGPVIVVGSYPERLLLEIKMTNLLEKGIYALPRGLACREQSWLHDGQRGVLTSAESISIITKILINLTARDEEGYVPGQPTVRLDTGEPILSKLVACNVIAKLYPMHDYLLLVELRKKWHDGMFLALGQPLREIQAYFGENVGLYFGFFGYFIRALLLKSILFLFLYFFPIQSNARLVFSLFFNILWFSLFLEGWKHRRNMLTLEWGTSERREERQVAVGGNNRIMGINLTFGHQKIISFSRELYFKTLLLSIPFVVTSLFVSAGLIVFYIHLESIESKYHFREKSCCGVPLYSLPEVSLTVAMLLLNRVYIELAKQLTEWENHESDVLHQKSLVAKLVIFYFFNNFGVHFYTAFYLQDLDKLRKHMVAQFVTYQILCEVSQSILSFLMTRKRHGRELVRSGQDQLQPLVLCQIQLQSCKSVYESEQDDYLDLFLSFCYMIFFSSVYPHATILCLLYNLTKILRDSWRFCSVLRRPFPGPATTNKIWHQAFERFEAIALVTNVALVWVSPEFHQFFKEYSTTHLLMALVALEHVMLALRSTVVSLILFISQEVRTRIRRMRSHSL